MTRPDDEDELTGLKVGPRFQIGIVSIGTRYCGIGFPGVYTKLVEYLGWMDEVITTS